jgi:hypothetical protein
MPKRGRKEWAEILVEVERSDLRAVRENVRELWLLAERNAA